jgi:flagellar hook protein FlgE
MSIAGILNNGVTGLMAQAQALSTISSNISNASTVGFKESETQFGDLIDDRDKYGTHFAGMGVKANDRLFADKQGTISGTGVNSNLAINGKGFFLVQEMANLSSPSTVAPVGYSVAGTQPELTRAGDFQADSMGYLVNGGGRALLGVKLSPGQAQPASASGGGSVSLNSLELVSLHDMLGYHEGTSKIDLNGSLSSALPVTADPTASNDTNTVATTMTVVDDSAAGRTAKVDLRIMKSAAAADGSTTWSVYCAGAKYTDTGAAVDGRDPSKPDTWGAPLGTFSLASTGRLAGTAGADVGIPMSLPGFKDVTLNLGKADGQNGVHSFPGEELTSVYSSGNGVGRGTLQDYEITPEGVVRGNFADGQSRDFFKVVTGTVTNAQGLESVSGTTFHMTRDAGALVVRDLGAVYPGVTAQTDGTGASTIGTRLASSSVEGSTTSMETQFSKLILAQRTYSANSKVVTAADEMTQTALSTKG